MEGKISKQKQKGSKSRKILISLNYFIRFENFRKGKGHINSRKRIFFR